MLAHLLSHNHKYPLLHVYIKVDQQHLVPVCKCAFTYIRHFVLESTACQQALISLLASMLRNAGGHRCHSHHPAQDKQQVLQRYASAQQQ